MSASAARRSGRGGHAGAAPVFAALGSEFRLRLVSRLSAEGPMSIARLAEGTGVTRQAVTKHLRILARAGLVRDARRGRAHAWQVESARLEEAQRWLREIEGQWDAALARLRAAVERPE